MAVYEHICVTCQYEWEDVYSIKADPPEFCPKCKEKTAKRLISLGGKGVVELTGNELINKIKADTKQLKKDAANNSNIYANLLGEDRYQSIQTNMDKNKRNR